MGIIKPNGSKDYNFARLLAFFIPLGLSASLTSISHVIINGTLSRAEHAEVIIANYAIALSLFGILERPVLVFRQMTSALAKGKASFTKIAIFFVKVSFIIAAVSALIGLTRIGDWIFTYGFNAEGASMAPLKGTFLVMAGVILCSGLRSLYQGIIINRLETKWVTWGVILRLFGMFAVACSLIFSGHSNSSVAGALIFLTGMAIECIISVWRGHSLIMADKDIGKTQIKQKEIRSFYWPMVFYLSIQTLLIPIIYALLSKIQDVHLGIASFALAFSITNLVLSFFMYTHQLVLQFYEHNKQAVIKSVVVFSIVPSVLLAMISFTPAGTWIMKTVLGANDVLAGESLAVLKFFIFKTFVFPWVDYFGGVLMLQKSTKSLLKPQLLNIISVIVLLVPMVYLYPSLNGKAGAIAASFGELAGLLALYFVVKRINKKFINEEKTAV